jgi:hypothetical protein
VRTFFFAFIGVLVELPGLRPIWLLLIGVTADIVFAYELLQVDCRVRAIVGQAPKPKRTYAQQPVKYRIGVAGDEVSRFIREMFSADTDVGRGKFLYTHLLVR